MQSEAVNWPGTSKKISIYSFGNGDKHMASASIDVRST
jgi:hypothetical protein